VGYVLVPMAPPRMLNVGFVDTHRDGLVTLAGNPYAAMPSLHAADSLIVGVVLAMVARRWWSKAFWLAWPAWVWFAVTATGNLLCGAASILVLFENRHELTFYWLAAVVFVAGSVLDILDGALARAGGKTTPFGAFLDSTTDRVSEGFMLTALAFVLA